MIRDKKTIGLTQSISRAIAQRKSQPTFFTLQNSQGSPVTGNGDISGAQQG
jgi:hypothetical protein